MVSAAAPPGVYALVEARAGRRGRRRGAGDGWLAADVGAATQDGRKAAGAVARDGG
jgi:hypothetical protein